MSKESKALIDLTKNSGIPQSKIYEAYNKYYSSNNWTPRTVRQKDIGFCSRLISDMAANGATEDEFERAILFSIIVLDCEKKKLNTSRAYEDLDILTLKQKYMDGNRKE